MTSRARVLAALNHCPPDRVPVDLSGHRSSGIAALAYPKLRAFLGLPAVPVRVYDVVQQLAVVDEDVLERFGVDTIELGRGFALRDSDWSPWTLPDGTECFVPAWTGIERAENRWIIRSESGTILAHMPDGALYFEQTYFPLAQEGGPATVREALAESMWTAIASPPGPVDADALRKGAVKLRAETDRAIIGLFGGNLFEIGQFCYRNDGFMMMLAAEPEKAHAFLDELMEIHLDNLDRFAANVLRVLQAAAQRALEPRQGAGRRQGHAALLRRGPRASGPPHRGRARRHQSRPDQLRRHERRRAQGRVRQRHHLLGRRLRHPRYPPQRHTRTGRPTRQRASRHPQPRRRLRHNILANVPAKNITAMFDAVTPPNQK